MYIGVGVSVLDAFPLQLPSSHLLELEFGVGGKLLAVTAEDGTLVVLSVAGKSEVRALSWRVDEIEKEWLSVLLGEVAFGGHLLYVN